MEPSVFRANPFKYPFYTTLSEKVSVDLFPLVLSFIENRKNKVVGEK